jgi:fucose 4-O-acetylase-like acetyltransferase
LEALLVSLLLHRLSLYGLLCTLLQRLGDSWLLTRLLQLLNGLLATRGIPLFGKNLKRQKLLQISRDALVCLLVLIDSLLQGRRVSAKHGRNLVNT